MATLLVRKLDDEAALRLKRRAAANNRSLESEARHILEKAVSDDMAERMKEFRAKARELRKLTRGTNQVPSEVIIREARESEGRPD